MREIKAWILSGVALLSPIYGPLGTAFGLVLVDLLVGLVAAWREKQPITSQKLKKTPIKLFVYGLTIVIAHVIEYNIVSLPLVQLSAGAIGLTEFKSVLENLGRISGEPVFDTILRQISARSSDDEPKGPRES